MLALSIVGVLSVLGATAAMLLICRRWSGDGAASVIATLLFAVSFPVFYYAPVGLVDPLTVALTAATVCAVLYDKVALAAIAAFFAVLKKETGIIVWGFAVPYFWWQPLSPARRAVAIGAILAAGMAGYMCSHTLFLPPGLAEHHFQPRLATVFANMARPKMWLGSLLSIGVQTFIVLGVWLATFRLSARDLFDPFKGGVAAALALAALGLMIGTADGRQFWYAQVFTTPVLAMLIASARPRMPLLDRVASAF